MLDGYPAALPKKGVEPPPQFLAHFYCGQTAGCIKAPLGRKVGLYPGDFVLDGDPAPLPKKGAEPPRFSAHVYCGQTAGWIKMALGMEIGLSPGDFVLDRDPAPLTKKKAESPFPIFCPFLLWPNGYMHQDATWYGGRPHPKGLCVRWGPSLPPQKGGRVPNFRPMSIAAKGLYGSRCHLVRR